MGFLYNVNMTQIESIKIWIDGAKDAMDTCSKLYNSKKYHHSLFFLHLSLEKMLKALFISLKDSSPPYIHDLKQLVELSGITVRDEEKDQLDEISEFNVAGRYEDYKYEIYKRATKEYTDKWIEIGKKLFNMFFEKV